MSRKQREACCPKLEALILNGRMQCCLEHPLNPESYVYTAGGTATDHSYTNGADWDEGADAWANYEPLVLMLPTAFLAMEWIYEAPSQCRCVALSKAVGLEVFLTGCFLMLQGALGYQSIYLCISPNWQQQPSPVDGAPMLSE